MDGSDFVDACLDNSDDESGEIVHQEQRPHAVGLQLVEAPKMAQRLDIGFARKAKRVDVKALKENLWSNLAPDGKKSGSTTFTSDLLTLLFMSIRSFLTHFQALCPRYLLPQMPNLRMFQCLIVLSVCCIFATRKV